MTDWEDQLNDAVAATTLLNAQTEPVFNIPEPLQLANTTRIEHLGANLLDTEIPTQPFLINEQLANQAAATYYPTPTAPDPRFAQQYAGALTNGICGTNVHHFECRHELRCYCGQVERLPLRVPEGL